MASKSVAEGAVVTAKRVASSFTKAEVEAIKRELDELEAEWARAPKVPPVQPPTKP